MRKAIVEEKMLVYLQPQSEDCHILEKWQSGRMRRS
jgi:hypothetical protein